MIVEDPKLLALFRLPGQCDLCARWSEVREPHHVVARGFGGGTRLDIPWNLLSLCPTIPGYYTGCHHEVHSGHITREDCRKAVIRREKLTWTPTELKEVLDHILRLPKGSVWRAICPQ